MKKFLAILMLASMSLAQASEVIVKEVAGNGKISAAIAVSNGEAGVMVKSTKTKTVTSRRITVTKTTKELVKVAGLELVDNSVMMNDVVCGKLVKKMNVGPRAKGSKTVLKSTGNCAVMMNKGASSTVISIVTK